jgi:HEAT repeat protein
MKQLLTIACVLFATPDAELDQARAEFKKALAENSASDLRAAAERLAATDQKVATDTLMDGYGKCATAIKALWADKIKHLQEREANGDFKIDYKTNPPSIPAGDVKKYERYLEADKLSKAVEAKILTIEAAKAVIVKALAKFKGDASVKNLIHEVTAGADWQRRAAAAEAMGQIAHKDVPAALLEALKKDGEQAVRVAVVDAFRELKNAAPEVVAAVAGQLQSDYWQLKVAAAQALQAIGGLAGIEPLIDALSKNDGRLRVEINDALVGLTGVNKHGDPAAWKAWWEQNREAVGKGTYVPKASDSAGAPGKNTTMTFYGIPVESRSIIFVLDRSGSMIEPSDWEVPKEAVSSAGGAGEPGSDIKKTGDRKIDIARWQLKKAIAQMAEGSDFNICFFSHEFVMLSDKMLKMSAATRKQAFDWIDKLDPYGGTNTFDALEKALGYAASGISGEKLQKSGVDTICLVTDGLPTAGQVADAKEIVARIRTLNKTRKVKIHTVGVFTVSKGADAAKELKEKEEGMKFLKQLAEENGGKFTGSGQPPAPDKPADPRKPEGK